MTITTCLSTVCKNRDRGATSSSKPGRSGQRFAAFLTARAVREDGANVKLATLYVLAYDDLPPDDAFVVRDTLTEDGRVGNVTDVQGVVAVKPVMHGAGRRSPAGSCSSPATGCAPTRTAPMAPPCGS